MENQTMKTKLTEPNGLYELLSNLENDNERASNIVESILGAWERSLAALIHGLSNHGPWGYWVQNLVMSVSMDLIERHVENADGWKGRHIYQHRELTKLTCLLSGLVESALNVGENERLQDLKELQYALKPLLLISSALGLSLKATTHVINNNLERNLRIQAQESELRSMVTSFQNQCNQIIRKTQQTCEELESQSRILYNQLNTENDQLTEMINIKKKMMETMKNIQDPAINQNLISNDYLEEIKSLKVQLQAYETQEKLHFEQTEQLKREFEVYRTASLQLQEQHTALLNELEERDKECRELKSQIRQIRKVQNNKEDPTLALVQHLCLQRSTPNRET